MKLKHLLATSAVAFMTQVSAGSAAELVMYCGVQEEWCRAMTSTFERNTGIKVSMTRKSNGEIFAQLKAEASNPKGDIWWGGTGDPHLQAADENLLEPYKSEKMADLYPWAVKQWEAGKGRTVGIYSGALGFGFNTKQLAGLGIPEPKCWADLLNPKLKDEIQVADPNSSGTSYVMVATLVQIMGEDKAFDYLKGLHKNISQYTKSGAAPARAVALGETTVGITFQHDMVTEAIGGAPIKVVSPCEGTGFEIGSMSIIKGAKNLDSAKKYYEWALTPEAQALAAQNKSYQVPSNKNSVIPKEAPKMSEIKLIDYDSVKYGSAAERSRLLSKWDKEVKALAK
jgi:iron(III) transport system substrate-binding protein